MRNRCLWRLEHEFVGGLVRCFWLCAFGVLLALTIPSNTFASELKAFPNYMVSFLWEDGKLNKIESRRDCTNEKYCANLVQIQMDNSDYASNNFENILICCTTHGRSLVEKVRSRDNVVFYGEKYGINKSIYFIVKRKNGDVYGQCSYSCTIRNMRIRPGWSVSIYFTDFIIADIDGVIDSVMNFCDGLSYGEEK